jgi:hypothetical protein
MRGTWSHLGAWPNQGTVVFKAGPGQVTELRSWIALGKLNTRNPSSACVGRVGGNPRSQVIGYFLATSTRLLATRR